MIENCDESVDKIGAFDALLSDLSKASDCLPHEHLIARLHGNGFYMKSLNLIYDYMSNTITCSKKFNNNFMKVNCDKSHLLRPECSTAKNCVKK